MTDLEDHIKRIIAEMADLNVHLESAPLRRLLRELTIIWGTFQIEWQMKLEGLGTERPRGGEWQPLRDATHFASGGEYNSLEDHWDVSLTPLQRFLPVIKDFVDDEKNGFPAQLNEKHGRSFRFASVGDIRYAEFPPHQLFAIMIGKYFFERYTAKHWRSADSAMRRKPRGKPREQLMVVQDDKNKRVVHRPSRYKPGTSMWDEQETDE